MKSSHLSDEAVAAFADGVLRGHARSRAALHVEQCAECRQAVRAQREAVLVLRQAPAPAFPVGLFERLAEVPSATPDEPVVLGGGPRLPLMAPTAAFVATPDADPADSAEEQAAEQNRVRGMIGMAALFAARARRRP